ncbi:MAG: F0F1 ATP synthase subunit B [Bacteroidota bacterium]
MILQPEFGLVFWMTLIFLLIVWLLKKFAWKPILKALSEREQSIQSALDSAKKAREEMVSLQAGHEKIIAEARYTHDRIVKEAREIGDKIIKEAKENASKEAKNIVAIARENIHYEKMAAITELKNQVAILSIEIAEKILKRELSEKDKQKTIIKDLLENIKMN